MLKYRAGRMTHGLDGGFRSIIAADFTSKHQLYIYIKGLRMRKLKILSIGHPVRYSSDNRNSV